MSSLLWKSFNLCFCKLNLKCLPIITFTPQPLPIQEDSQQNPPTINNPSPLTSTAAISASSFDDYDDSIPDFSSAFASHRFFLSTPGSSNSIFEQPRMLMDSEGAVNGGAVAVQKFSADPYADFRKSMQEMIEAHEWTSDVKSSGEFLHELLLCYLTLNPKHTHKFVIDAFADVVVSLVSPPVGYRKSRHHRRRRGATPSRPV
ncbi:hypothetical protein F511_24100 [Dorcoceras hygrometricum]|uniref:Transcription repressor n=1 Tax=Dorcoceras hygrometricum TaxID=472368 RepID=A0A2Z7ADQ8_9LAMI|nr:hypothetical protein F511_24100 [Dorcoceras hygrometricum]